ncbi:MAG: hypothetical protein RL660_1849 [Bacteroidota bacterium]|jgi:RNA polymerase sigma factor (sigma-70 family)
MPLCLVYTAIYLKLHTQTIGVLVQHADQHYIQGLVANDSNTVQAIYKQFAPKLLNWMKQHGASTEDAQDVFQDALVDIFRKAQSQVFSLSCPFEAFLFVVVRNKWFTKAKNNQKTMVTDPEVLGYKLDAQADTDAEAVMQYEKQYNLLQSTLLQISESCREVLQLSWRGARMEEVAEKMKVTYAYVRKKKSLCLAELVSLVKQSPQFESLSFISA